MKRWKRFWHGLVVETLATAGLFLVIGGSLGGESLDSPGHNQVNRMEKPTQTIVDPNASSSLTSSKAERSVGRPIEQWLSALVHFRQ